MLLPPAHVIRLVAAGPSATYSARATLAANLRPHAPRPPPRATRHPSRDADHTERTRQHARWTLAIWHNQRQGQRVYSDEEAEVRDLSGQDVDDADLIARVAGGDTEAVAVLYDRYGGAIYSLCYRILGDATAAEDVAQEVFVRVWRNAASFEPERGRASTWMLRIAHNIALNEIRRRQSRPALAPNVEWVQEAANISDPSAESDPATATWLRERADVIRGALSQLPEAQRKVLELAFYGGLSQSEIAAVLNDPLGTVKSRVRAGMLRLRELLSAAGADGLS